MDQATEDGRDERHRTLALERPVLVVGAPRSGTTWLHRLLLADPRFCGGQETHFFVSFGAALRDFDRKLGMSRPHGLGVAWTRDELLEELRRLWTRTMAPAIDARPEAELMVEKTPDHALHLDVIAEVLPEARIIHLVRDSRAVAASLLAAHRDGWGREWSTGDAGVAGSIWRRSVAAAEAAGESLGSDRFLRVHFESLRTDAPGTLDGILRFLGVPAPKSGFEALVSKVGNASREHPEANDYPLAGALEGRRVEEPPGFVRSGSVDGWRSELGRRQARAVWRETGELMSRLGYDRDGGPRTSSG